MGVRREVRAKFTSAMVARRSRVHSVEIAVEVLLLSPPVASALLLPRDVGVAQRWRLMRISRAKDSTSGVKMYAGEERIVVIIDWVRLAKGRKVVGWA